MHPHSKNGRFGHHFWENPHFHGGFPIFAPKSCLTHSGYPFFSASRDGQRWRSNFPELLLHLRKFELLFPQKRLPRFEISFPKIQIFPKTETFNIQNHLRTPGKTQFFIFLCHAKLTFLQKNYVLAKVTFPAWGKFTFPDLSPISAIFPPSSFPRTPFLLPPGPRYRNPYWRWFWATITSPSQRIFAPSFAPSFEFHWCIPRSFRCIGRFNIDASYWPNNAGENLHSCNNGT